MSNSIKVINRANKRIQIGFFKNRGPCQPSFDAEQTIEVEPNASKSVELAHEWEGRVQKVSGATTDPATWAEIHFNAWQNMTFADISLIRGYNGSMMFSSSDGTLHTGMTGNLWTEAPQQFKVKDTRGNDVLAPTEPYTGGRNDELVAYYRRKVKEGNAYLIPDDHPSSHGTKDTHINLDVYEISSGSSPSIVPPSGSRVVALRSNANNKFVCADNFGNNPLIAN
ncbi:unnamed protein product, partial [Rotaria magnacalcarata]